MAESLNGKARTFTDGGVLEASTTTDFTYSSGTSELDAYEYDNTDAKSKRIQGSFDNDAFVTGGSKITVRVKEKIDGTNYRTIDTKEITVGTQPENFSFDYTTNRDFKITYQIDVSEGADRAVKRNIKVWKME